MSSRKKSKATIPAADEFAAPLLRKRSSRHTGSNPADSMFALNTQSADLNKSFSGNFGNESLDIQNQETHTIKRMPSLYRQNSSVSKLRGG